VKFRIPEGAEVAAEATEADSKVSRPEFSDPSLSDKKTTAASVSARPGSQIEFLCPNGHRLHGPASLQGKPGQCPDCGSRFRIPTYEDISAEEEAVSQISLGRVDGREGSDVGPQAVPGEPPPGSKESSVPLGEMRASREESAMPTTISSRSRVGHDMHALFIRLWEMRPTDTSIKLYLRDGETIIPHEFLKRVSQQSRLGLFTAKESDGTTSLMAVAWDSVVRVTVQGLKELPKELVD
jgi:hypothetical protein